jgi:hypothetical protein
MRCAVLLCNVPSAQVPGELNVRMHRRIEERAWTCSPCNGSSRTNRCTAASLAADDLANRQEIVALSD